MAKNFAPAIIYQREIVKKRITISITFAKNGNTLTNFYPMFVSTS